MSKSKYESLIGKFVELAFTYKHSKNAESKYIKAFGEIRSVEDGSLEFIDNDNYKYKVNFNKIFECNVQDKPRRTKEEWQGMVEKELNKKSKIGRL